MQKQQMDWGAAERGGGTQPLFSLLSVCPCFLSVCMSAYLSVCLPACRRVQKVFFFKPSDALPLPPKLTSSPHPLFFYLLITSTFSSLSYFDLQATSLDFSVQFPSLVFFSTFPHQHQLPLSALPATSTARGRSPETWRTTYLSPPLSVLSASPLSSSLLWPPVAQMLWHMPLHVHAITHNISLGWKYACGGAHL